MKLLIFLALVVSFIVACSLSPGSQLQVCIMSSCAEAEGEEINQKEDNTTDLKATLPL